MINCKVNIDNVFLNELSLNSFISNRNTKKTRILKKSHIFENKKDSEKYNNQEFSISINEKLNKMDLEKTESCLNDSNVSNFNKNKLLSKKTKNK